MRKRDIVAHVGIIAALSGMLIQMLLLTIHSPGGLIVKAIGMAWCLCVLYIIVFVVRRLL